MKIRRILLECTHTFENDINTGIQRVVRNIVKESRQIAEDFGLDVVPVILRYGRFWKIEGKESKLGAYRMACSGWLKRMYGKIQPVVMKISPSGTLEKWILATARHVGTILLNAILGLFFIADYYKKRIIYHKSDMILLLDSSWVYPIWPAVRYAKKRGAKVGLVIYDLTPINNRQFYLKVLSKMFEKWFESAIREVDFFMAISKTVQDEIQKYVAANHPGHKLIENSDFFVLGSVMDNVSVKADVCNEVINVFDTNNNSETYLVVGTIEPRKNHDYLLDVFEQVWKEFPFVRLCIAGRIGWQCEDFVQKVKSHVLYKKSIYMFNDLSDTEIDYCYSRAKYLLCPSHEEGFGLPIVEALFKGLPVLASDIPVFREVGKDFCAYFDQTDPASLASIICKIHKEGEMPQVRRAEQYHLANWTDSCRELLTKSLAFCQDKHQRA